MVKAKLLVLRIDQVARFQLDLYLHGQTCRGGIGSKKIESYAVFAFKHGTCRILYLDNPFEAVVGNVGGHVRGKTADPLHQIQRVECLIDHHTATLSVPCTSPCRRIIVVGISAPDDRPKCPYDSSVRQLLETEHIFLIAVLMTNAKLCATARDRRTNRL